MDFQKGQAMIHAHMKLMGCLAIALVTCGCANTLVSGKTFNGFSQQAQQEEGSSKVAVHLLKAFFDRNPVGTVTVSILSNFDTPKWVAGSEKELVLALTSDSQPSDSGTVRGSFVNVFLLLIGNRDTLVICMDSSGPYIGHYQYRFRSDSLARVLRQRFGDARVLKGEDDIAALKEMLSNTSRGRSNGD
jgi:hypothetical protein